MHVFLVFKIESLLSSFLFYQVLTGGQLVLTVPVIDERATGADCIGHRGKPVPQNNGEDGTDGWSWCLLGKYFSSRDEEDRCRVTKFTFFTLIH